MNIAFPALLIFLFVLPGLIFNLAFYQADNTPLKYISLTHKTIVCSAITIILHSFWLYLTIHWFHYDININQILILIAGVKDDLFTSIILSISTAEIFATFIYLISLYIAAYLIGSFFRWGIRRTKLDKLEFFKIDHPWYYLFTGHDWTDGKPDGVRIAAIVEIAKKGYLYVGWLDKFYLNRDGSIDRLILTSAMRREIKKDKPTDADNEKSLLERFYPIDGHYFILKYSEVKSLNVQFLKLEEITPQ